MEKEKVEQENELRNPSVNEGGTFSNRMERSLEDVWMWATQIKTFNILWFYVMDMHLYMKYIYIPDWHTHNTCIMFTISIEKKMFSLSTLMFSLIYFTFLVNKIFLILILKTLNINFS